MFFMLITLIIAGFQVFTPALILGGSGTLNSSIHVRFYVLHMYLRSFREGQLGYGSALAWVLIVFSAVAVLLLFRNFEKFVHYEESGSTQEKANG
jgi:multiple sugar transport system permease protein